MAKESFAYAGITLGILGGLVGAPGYYCAGTLEWAGNPELFSWLALIAALAGMIVGTLSKVAPVFAGIVMFAAGLASFATGWTGNVPGLLAAALFITGAVLTLIYHPSRKAEA